MEKTSDVSHNTPFIGAVRIAQVFDFEQLLGRVTQKTIVSVGKCHLQGFRGDQRRPGMLSAYFRVGLTELISLSEDEGNRGQLPCPVCHSPKGQGGGNE
jgi:hypothetical protein